MAKLELRNVSKSFGATRILRDVDLEVRDGEFLTLLGPSGCGKSTLLRIIAGLEQPSSGSVAIGDRVVNGCQPKDRDIAMVFQTYALYPHMTVADNLALPLTMRRLSTWQRVPILGSLPEARKRRAAIAREVEEIAASLELSSLLHRRPGQLSGGQRQRVALARAMVRRPAVFLMDEPLSNLDSTLRAQMRTEIAGLRRKLTAAFIYVTHDQTEAMTMSDRVAVMFGGNIVQIGSPQALYTQPATRQVAEFVGTPRINMFEATIRDDQGIEIGDAVFPTFHNVRPGARVYIGIRPEHLRMSERGGRGALTGRVQRVEYMGNDALAYCGVLGQREPLVIRISPQQASTLRNETTVHIATETDALLVFDRDGNAIPSRRGFAEQRTSQIG